MIHAIPPGDIGAALREARQRGTLTLRQVSDSTKVPVDILQAIERNDIARVPGGLYVRGYVRSFAAAVGLDPEATVAAFVAQFPSGSVRFGYPAAERAAAAVVPPSEPTASANARLRDGFTLLRFTAVSALSAAIGIYMGMATGQERDEATQRASAAGLMTAGELPRAGELAVAARAEPERGVHEVYQRPVETPAPDATPAIDVETASAVVPAPEAELPFAIEPAPIDHRPTLASPLAVVVAAKSPSWVIVTVDGRKTVNRLLQVGEHETLEARRDLVLTAGDAGAIVMTLNGRLARSIGRPGETVTAHVSSANFRDYLRR